MECVLPGRFSVLAGANGSGKSTIVDSILLSHHDVFPFTPRPSSAALSKSVATRTIEVAYALEEDDESPLGILCQNQIKIPEWLTVLSASMGRVSASQSQALAPGQLPVLYLSPTRNPGMDLAGREARVIVELLKAQALRDTGDKSLKALRAKIGALIGSLLAEWPVADAEARVTASLGELTEGVSARVPYFGTTLIDDTFLARIFEFLLGTAGMDRAASNRLETEGLGYANLLQLAVILAAIPDLTHELDDGDADTDEKPGQSGEDEQEPDRPAEEADADGGTSDAVDTNQDDPRTDEERRGQIAEAEQNRELADDSLFAGQFHAIVLLEEPEAHLHPQLQHGLVRYLKEVVDERPEVQVIMTTHSDEIVAGCDPEDLVVFRRDAHLHAVARTVKTFGLSSGRLAQARRHLDVTRSASLFADRAVLVEGVTDAIVLRAIARVWAGEDRVRKRFVDALTITVVGSRIGEWLPDLLARDGSEIVTKLAVLRDSDHRPPPKWIGRRENDHFAVFWSKPTLEPALTAGNEDIVETVLQLIKAPVPAKSDRPPFFSLADWLEKWISKKGKGRKAAFADRFSALCYREPEEVTVPAHFEALLDFVWTGFLTPPPPNSGAPSA